ncbi:hypothetical protein, partial [Gulosibacter sediminis]|uniref:hypothetical protein n=1 Tax=Gulosibacter sediminis TaxID=1729695 RepID=UPI0024A8554F
DPNGPDRAHPLGSDRDTYLQPVLRDRGNKTATERCKNPATKRGCLGAGTGCVDAEAASVGGGGFGLSGCGSP